MKVFSICVLLGSVVGLLVSGGHADSVIYREIFPEGPHVKQNGWHYHVNTNAKDFSTENTWGGAQGATKLEPVNSYPTDTRHLWKGYIWLPKGNQYLLWTREFEPLEEFSTISWHMALQSAGDSIRVAVLLGGEDDEKWYVSEQEFVDELGNAKIAETEAIRLELKSSDWLRLDFEADKSLKLASKEAETLPEDAKLLGIGFYCEKRSAIHVFDTVEIHK